MQRWIVSAAIFFAKLPAELTSFRLTHIAPPLSHFLALLGRQRSEPPAGIPDGLPLFGRELAKSLEALTEALLLVRWQSLPLLEALVGFFTLLGIHVPPLTRSVEKSLLPFRRQLIPRSAESLKKLLLVLAQLVPGNSRHIGLGPGRSDQGHHDGDQYDDGLHGVTSLRGRGEAG